jgi:Uma2 family endonuclease
MTAMPVMPPEEKEWTVEDVDRLPDDGLQYELLDGVLLVSPAPVRLHQRVLTNLLVLLHPLCPPHLEVLGSPVDWRPDMRTSLQPDVLVVPTHLVPGSQNLSQALPLVSEILSPSTRRKDLVFKRSKYEDEGNGAYWVIDPNEPSVQAYELRDGRFVDVGSAKGPDTLRLGFPFPVRLTPSELVAR